VKIWDRFIVMSVLFAITALILTVVDSFLFPVDINSLFSALVLTLMVVVFWFVAPWIAKYIKVGKEPE